MADEKEKKEEKRDDRLIDILRIRKSNTKNSLWQSPEGKAFIVKAREGVKKSRVVENSAFLYVFEVIE